MRRPAVVVFFALALACVPRPAAAWGFEVHKFIMGRSIALLPPEIRPFFERHRLFVVEHTIDPDLWRTVGWLEEPPRHFMDMDAYGAYPFTEQPHDFDAAVAKFGREFVEKNGTVPWRTQEIYTKLVEAFTQKQGYSRDNIKLFSSVIAHYTADAHVPFHAVLNHDGQLTGQWGIHSRFETELFDRYRHTLNLAGRRPSEPVTNAREFIFGALRAGFPLAQPLLDADRAAAAGRETYDDAYFAVFFRTAKPILEQRLEDSIAGVAAIITAAWVEAGRPALPVAVKSTPRKVRRQ